MKILKGKLESLLNCMKIKTMYQNLQDATTVVLEGKFIVVNPVSAEMKGLYLL